MIFRFYAFRFTFEVLDTACFQPGAAGNAFRGAFGHIFRRIACVPDCAGPGSCQIRHQCAYADLFEPACLDGPSGLADSPRPFVIRAASLDGKSYQPGETLAIDVHIFRLYGPAIAYFVLAFHQLALEGIGVGRGRIRLVRVSALDQERREAGEVYRNGQFIATSNTQPECLKLDHPGTGIQPEYLTLRFVTPTELKSDGVILREAPFGIVLARARDRIANAEPVVWGWSHGAGFSWDGGARVASRDGFKRSALGDSFA
jgi:hypothetical protein